MSFAYSVFKIATRYEMLQRQKPYNGSAGEPWPAGPSVPSAGSTAAGGRNQRGSPADPFARPSAVGRTSRL